MNRCPIPADLTDYAFNRLVPGSAEAIESHLESCQTCQSVLDQLSNDPLMARLATLARPARPLTPGLRAMLGSPPLALREGWHVAASPEDRDNPFDEPSPASRPPPIVPGLEILGELGRGGVGVVYLARQAGLRRLVAVKVLIAGTHATPDAVTRFRAESRGVARVQHRNLIQVYNVGEFDGLPYCVMEYAEGGSLAQRITGAPWPARDAADLVADLASALEAVHALNIVHRDLKPANILLAADGTPKVADFGLARQGGESLRVTRSCQVVGTPCYMAPEQAAGQSRDVGPAADIHALGAILYELITGGPPFQGPGFVDVVFRVLTHDPTPPRRINPSLPRDLETICLRCLQKEPRRRYARAADLENDLRRFLANRPIRARAVGLAERVWMWTRRQPGRASLLASLVLAVFTLAVGGPIAAHRLNRLDADLDRANTRLQITTADLYPWNIKAAHEALLAGNRDRGHALLDAYPTPGMCDVRGFEWYLLDHYRGERVAPPSPGKKAARLPSLTTAIGLAPETGAFPAHPDDVRTIRFSPDGKRFVTTARTIRLWDTASATMIREIDGHGDVIPHAVFTPDGALLLTCSWDRTIKAWDAITGRALFTLIGHDDVVVRLALSPDGRGLASGSQDCSIKVWDLVTRKNVLTLKGHSEIVQGLDWSRDGRLLASGSRDDSARIWDAATGRELQVLKGHRNDVAHVAFHPNGRLVASVSVDETARVWDLETGKTILTLRGHAGPVQDLAFHPKGDRLATASNDGTVRLWDLTTGESTLILRYRSPAYALDFSPDGQRLATAFGKGLVRVWQTTPPPTR